MPFSIALTVACVMLLCKRYKMWFCKKVWKKENLLGLTLFICLLAVVGSKSNNSADIRTIVVDKGKNNNIRASNFAYPSLGGDFYFNILFKKKNCFTFFTKM